MLFAVQWARQHRQLLPELFAVHLESERVAMGANWKGRTTRPFGPVPLEEALEGIEAENAQDKINYT
jgi:hypothetical protein